jgi:hypothetical protein
MASFDPTCRRDLKSSTSAISGIKRAGFFSLAFLAVDCYNGSSNDEKVAPGTIMKEEHEASEVETGSHLMGMGNLFNFDARRHSED